MSLAIDLSGRVAIVTGAARGLGRADALALARAGADVAVADLADSDGTAAEIEALGRRALAVRCDVADAGQVVALVARTVEELGAVGILVNNAGAYDHLARLGDQRPELWQRDLDVNLTGAFHCSQAVWPHLVAGGWGRIVNTSSVVGTLGGFGQAGYAAAKAGLLGLTRSLALEGAPHGITVNAIVAGIIGTEALGSLDPVAVERMARRTAFRRPGEPDDVAHAVAFLCSDLAGYVTGIELNVSGGIELFAY